jgi:hypothetical protein
MNPPVQEVIDRLRDATQLNLTLGESLRYHSPTLGSMQLRDAPAFAVMELLAERQIGDGYWEKTKDGYRLTGKSLALRPPATALTTGKLAALGGGGGLLAALAAAAVVYTRRRAAVRAGGRAEASGPPAEKAPPERRGKPVADGQA